MERVIACKGVLKCGRTHQKAHSKNAAMLLSDRSAGVWWSRRTIEIDIKSTAL